MTLRHAPVSKQSDETPAIWLEDLRVRQRFLSGTHQIGGGQVRARSRSDRRGPVPEHRGRTACHYHAQRQGLWEPPTSACVRQIDSTRSTASSSTLSEPTRWHSSEIPLRSPGSLPMTSEISRACTNRFQARNRSRTS